MTDLDREVNQYNSKSDPSRARQRKIKREYRNGASPKAVVGSSQSRHTRQRTSSRNGPSVRERLVSSQINISASKLQSIQGKVGATLKSVSHLPDPGEVTRKAINGIGKNRTNTQRKNETQRKERLYESTPKAETRRKTIANQQFHPRKNSRQYDAHSESVPPVMVRGGMGGMAFGRVASSRMHKQKSPKRRFDVPLNIPGAEIRLPSIPLIHLGWRGVSFMMVLMMTACLFLMWKAPVFQVNAIEAEGLKRLTVGDMNAVMGTFGKSVFKLDPTVLEQTLQQAFPELSKISVQVNLPASVKVAVTEREPVIAWTQDGKETWVDADGISFPPRGTPANPLVRIEGYGTPPSIHTDTSTNELKSFPGEVSSATGQAKGTSLRLSPKLVSSILALGAKMPADTMLVYDSEHGLGWDDPNGWEVYFGAEDQDMEMKLSVYQAMVERLQSEGVQPAMISVEFVHAPYYRMER
jgi:cell division protein FtsQ